jgi:site-specific DNA-methyltransferase (adenine-specific)
MKSTNEEAVSTGFYEPEHWPGYYYPKIQILTIQELLDGKNVEYPRHAPVATFKRAPRKQKISNDKQRQML